MDFRLAMLDASPRHKAVLAKAAAMAGWGAPPVPGRGKGVALVESFGTIVAEVVEVDMTGGAPRVTNVWCAADPGFAMNPDGFRNQMEGGIVFGLTAALHGEITIHDGAVEQSNFHDYPLIRMDECPQIAVAIINGDATRLGGAGEPGLPPAAPALANAIFAATGRRLRELPVARQFV
ncbi:MAG: molybdopterin cofactor-binding domain-containing protein [Pseudomonadota bacterium]